MEKRRILEMRPKVAYVVSQEKIERKSLNTNLSAFFVLTATTAWHSRTTVTTSLLVSTPLEMPCKPS